ncbi:hypothetical protein VIGAN_07136700 [Vigna angularis var. angularis]|uniref:Uncharacterized protein n=1 Tax=Vigna angularis var. angularis TaxID=157739 RepID=A0A0S3SII3_PHAAN|nr:hypothetical protein VIGAN_07136700 [Vigna angularis var. angularis]
MVLDLLVSPVEYEDQFEAFEEEELKEVEATSEGRKTLRLFTVKDMRFWRRGRGKLWQGVNLEHPATFATVAMDWELKEMIIRDLDKFVERKGLYKSVGKARKKIYLLSGPSNPRTAPRGSVGSTTHWSGSRSRRGLKIKREQSKEGPPTLIPIQPKHFGNVLYLGDQSAKENLEPKQATD